ncbi:MAG: hypothetical protein HN521_20135, partial [Candidatus Latescibacteria bacterium]|nr:hypothetical protein [Candidatus Latescibacterota bacterium]
MGRNSLRFILYRLIALSCVLCLTWNVEGASIKQVRVPDEGLQPQVVVGPLGLLHLIYFKGEAKGGDLFYTTQQPGETVFSEPIQVNSIPKSIIATGTVRGAHLALGRAGRVHVAWMGSPAANGGTHEKLPMFYTRLNDLKTGFEPQQNVIHHAYGLDGGGSVAADSLGNVYVAWHAGNDEASRKVWLTRSSDDGKTFATETPVWNEETGACGCCGMRVFAEPSGALYVMYRSAKDMVHRDMYVLKTIDFGETFAGLNAHAWEANSCPMSTAVMYKGDHTWAAWETRGQVYFSRVGNLEQVHPLNPNVEGGKNKHPVLAQNNQGDVLLAWSTGSGWKKAGVVTYQLFDALGKALGEPVFGGQMP